MTLRRTAKASMAVCSSTLVSFSNVSALVNAYLHGIYNTFRRSHVYIFEAPTFLEEAIYSRYSRYLQHVYKEPHTHADDLRCDHPFNFHKTTLLLLVLVLVLLLL